MPHLMQLEVKWSMPGLAFPMLRSPRRLDLVVLPPQFITGTTKNRATGAALAGCKVDLYRTIDDTMVQSVLSDGSGNYAFLPVNNANGPYYVVAYLAGAPDMGGTTVNTVVGT